MEKDELGELETRNVVAGNGEAAFEADIEDNLSEAVLAVGDIVAGKRSSSPSRRSCAFGVVHELS